MTSVPDTADVVAKRRDILAVLSSPKTKPEIVDQASFSRSTVDRAVDELLSESFVSRQGSTYEATYAGRQAVAAYEQFLDRLDALTRAQPILDALPSDVAVDPATLHDAEVIESTMEAPQAPIEAATALGTGATKLYATGPSVVPHYITEVAELVEDNDDTELVLTEAAFDVVSSTYSEAFSSFSAAENMAIYVTDETLPYAVWIAEKPETMVSGIIVHTENGIRGVINSDAEAMNEWAKATYEQFKAGAERVD